MTKCEEKIKAKYEKEFGVQLGEYKKCLEMSDESPEKFKAECKEIPEEFFKNFVKASFENKFPNEYPNDQDGQYWYEKYAKDTITCSIIMKEKGVSGMAMLGCLGVGCYEMAVDFFEGKQNPNQVKFDDLNPNEINDLQHIGKILCTVDDREYYKHEKQIFEELNKLYKEYNDEESKNTIKEYEEIESTIDIPTELMKSLYKEMQREIEVCEADSTLGDEDYTHIQIVKAATDCTGKGSMLDFYQEEIPIYVQSYCTKLFS